MPGYFACANASACSRERVARAVLSALPANSNFRLPGLLLRHDAVPSTRSTMLPSSSWSTRCLPTDCRSCTTLASDIPLSPRVIGIAIGSTGGSIRQPGSSQTRTPEASPGCRHGKPRRVSSKSSGSRAGWAGCRPGLQCTATLQPSEPQSRSSRTPVLPLGRSPGCRQVVLGSASQVSRCPAARSGCAVRPDVSH